MIAHENLNKAWFGSVDGF